MVLTPGINALIVLIYIVKIIDLIYESGGPILYTDLNRRSHHVDRSV